ncbi:MAG: hypothetical protein JWQ43_3799 [Glaciihabitans sp.]|nr:hypothetical protein [Glaciihabitans sp.]
MSDDKNVATPPGSGGDDYADTNDRDIQAKQADSSPQSATLEDPDVDSDDVTVLPGTGGPDDVGDIEVDPSELNLGGHS